MRGLRNQMPLNWNLVREIHARYTRNAFVQNALTPLIFATHCRY